jgi:hypothetical protein
MLDYIFGPSAGTPFIRMRPTVAQAERGTDLERLMEDARDAVRAGAILQARRGPK